MDLIIKTSSNQESIVLDCFCGSGSTLKSAHLLNRRWIGIDQSEYAIKTSINNIKNIDESLLISKAKYELVKLKNTETTSKILQSEDISKSI